MGNLRSWPAADDRLLQAAEGPYARSGATLQLCAPKTPTMVIRFGGITDRRANTLHLVKDSLHESGWLITTISAAGSAMDKRQADAFLRTKTKPLMEYDVWTVRDGSSHQTSKRQRRRTRNRQV